MTEAKLPLTSVGDPRASRGLLVEAARRGPSVVDAETGMIHVLRYREVERLLHEPRLRGIGLALFDAMGIAGGPLRDWYGALMFTNDGLAHDRLRRLVSKAFTPRAVERLRPIAAACADEQLAALRAGGSGDLVPTLAPVPMHVMCTLLGVPPEAVPDFIAWVDALSPTFAWMDPAQIAAAESASVALLAYVRDLVEERSHAPADDLITALIRAEHAGDRLTRDETIAMVANLLVGGHDTTSSQMGCSLLALLVRPEALARVRSEPSCLANVVAEAIRLEPGIPSAPRTAIAPIRICGIERPAGSLIATNFLTAHRDPEMWDDADDFRPERFDDPETPRLLAFGGGPHYCLGAALARTTIEEAVRGVAALAPSLREDPADIGWVQVLGQSPARLAVTV